MATLAERVPELRIELAPAVASVERAGRRLADLLATVEDPARQVTGLAWSLGELAAHLAARSELFAAYLVGSRTPQGEIEGFAAENERQIRERIDRPFDEHVSALRANVGSFVAASRGKLGADPFPWYSGLTLDVASGTGILLAELLVHGFDLARTLGHRWPIHPADARTIIRASVTQASHYVDRDATRGMRATFRVLVRGGPAFRVRVEDGTAAVEPAVGEADCTIRAEPVALVLVTYGRQARWRAIASGRLLATGPKPWRALWFDRAFRSP